MKKILFVVGPALGHAARAVVVARRLQQRGYAVHVAGADTRALTQEVVGPDFPFHKLGDEAEPTVGRVTFADGLLRCFESLAPDAVCYDLTPLPWLTQLDPFPVPEVYITNIFLTRLGAHPTVQDAMLARKAEPWNRLRAQRGLPPLTDSRALYERDLVLLADPPDLLTDQALPAHYRVIGPCSWTPRIPLPDAVRPMQDLLYLSIGSTGRRAMPEAFIRRLADELGCRHIVALKGSGIPENITTYSYDRLPGDAVLKRARFALTHGGTGSVYQALERGVPVGCWPTHANHRLLGRWLEQSGLAVLFDPESWHAKLAGLREQRPALAARAQALAASLETLDSGLEASRHIETLLTNSRNG